MSDSRPGFVDVDTYLSLPTEPETWLLKPLVPSSGAALIYAEPKIGKSYLGIQLALALTGQAPDWIGFPVMQTGRVLYLQLDTPRSVWSLRFFNMLKQGGLSYDRRLLLADRESVDFFPFDILQPAHMNYLRVMCTMHKPVAVIIDTLREVHSGDEDSSTTARNVIANLVAATMPAALILISHSRKPHPDTDKDLLADHRGSSYITGRMDAIMRLTKSRIYYTGRSIEQGDVRLERLESGLWAVKSEETLPVVYTILADPNLATMRAKARALAMALGKSEEAAMSHLRRLMAKEGPKLVEPATLPPQVVGVQTPLHLGA